MESRVPQPATPFALVLENPGELPGLGMPLPQGRIVISDEGEGDTPAIWMTDAPAPAELWNRLLAVHPRTGLYPLLLDALDGDDGEDGEFRPWASGELLPEEMSSPDDYDAATLLAHWWTEYSTPDEDDDLTPEQRLEVTAPYGDTWPGLAPAVGTDTGLAEKAAAEFADHLASVRPWLRLGLVPAASGADALTAAGWTGPANYESDTAQFSAVLRDWERRFGARVVSAGFATLALSVPVPPDTPEAALRIAAEHFAFCPDNIWQGAGSLTAYAEEILGAHSWNFWWD
jgi:hypothetical protein